VPRPHPKEFRDDVVEFARRGETLVKQIAKDFGISESFLRYWLHQADVEDGAKPGVTKSEPAELRDLERRNKLLEQENEVLRRAAAYFAQAHLPGKELPARPRARRRRDPCHGDVPGPQPCPPAALPVAHRTGRRP